MRRILSLLFALGLAACATSDDLVDEGFTIEPMDDGSFAARYDPPRDMTRENLERNLLWHVARATIDRNYSWFVMEGADVDQDVEATAVAESGVTMQPATPEHAPATTAPMPRDTQRAGISFSRSGVATAKVWMWKERPTGASAQEASRVLDRIMAERDRQ